MLKHTGKARSFYHNLRLAILLCLNAGYINAAGFIAFNVLTTNVTGHAALLAVNLATGKLNAMLTVTLWLFLFFSGAFVSAFYIRKTGANKSHAYTIPIAVIIIILLLTIIGNIYDQKLCIDEYFAGALLFAMGMQNALVSMISGSVVRTTHLTGMFTDLGIDLSSLILTKAKSITGLKRKILLRAAIIISFLIGGIFGAFIFIRYSYIAFIIPILLLIIALFSDYFQNEIFKQKKEKIDSSI